MSLARSLTPLALSFLALAGCSNSGTSGGSMPSPRTALSITPQDGNGAAPALPGATPATPGVISSLEDVLAFLAASHTTVVIAVGKRLVNAKPGSKPLSVTVLQAGEAQDVLKLANVAGSVLQGA